MITRARRSWTALAPEQRLAALCSVGLFVTMFLPWYTRDTTAVVQGRLQTVATTLMAWKAFSFVEAAILLVAVGVLLLLFARGERRAFHLPGGDGTVITAAGVWVGLLVFYRLIDNKTGATTDFQKVDYGVSWGIFVTLLCGVALAYAGQRLRQAHVTEPPLNGRGGPAPTVAERRAARRESRERREEAQRPEATTSVARGGAGGPGDPRPAGPEIDGGEQLSFDEQE
jgi:hypothetical protein